MDNDWEKIGPVEIHTTGNIVSIRTYSDTLGDELVLDRSEWNELVRSIKDGELDHV